MQHPFEVMCINSNWTHVSRWERIKAWILGRPIINPVFSAIYTVVDIQAYKGKEYYYLAEAYKDDCYDAAGFVRLSYRDEAAFGWVPRKKEKY
jgi:hypothetical protein